MAKGAQKITGTRSCRVDLAWASQRVGIEYDGGAYHGDQTKDRKRREALAHMGWTIFVCGSEQLQHFGEHERILDLLESVLVRRRGQHRADRQAAEELKDRLLAATRLGRGMRRLLLSPDIPDSMVPEACIRW